MKQSRRNFIKLSALASCSAMMPGFLTGMNRNLFSAAGDRKLVIIQLSGGNDGLNTIIPFQQDTYYSSRPRLAVPKGDVLKLTDELGLNPAMEALRPLWDDGLVSVVNSIGYPNPDRSHFRSMDIWHSGSNSDEYWDTGWLGRYLDASCAGCAQPHGIIEVDDVLSLAVKGKFSKGLAVKDANRLYRTAQSPYFKALAQQYATAAASPPSALDYMYKTMTETISSAEYIHEKMGKPNAKGEYPMGPLAKGLKMIAGLMNSGVDTSVFYLSLPGFDTHVNQRMPHDRKLKMYADAVAAFMKDLKQKGLLDNTLIMTFSEFGRRVKQNASGGTDHGKANSLFLMGGKLTNPGFYNPAPDLSNLDEGDVAFQVDFREVYATVLKNWMGADDKQILGRSFKTLALV